MKKKEWIPYGIAIIALVIGACYDYQITDFFHQNKNIIAIAFERFGPLFVQIIAMITMGLLHRIYDRKLYWIPAWMICFYMIQDFMHYWIDPTTIRILCYMVVAVGLVMMMNTIIQRIPIQLIHKRITFFVFFTCVLLSAMLITFLIKNAWGRIRYRDMTDMTQFCVWYRPCGLFGNQSFPSGHTTAFTTILCFLKWKDDPKQNVPLLRYIIITIFIILMPITRMMMGAHFLSDTAMGFIVTYTMYLLFRQAFSRGGRL